jgi:capsid portal protein
MSYFDNKTVPPLAILVSGGSLGAETHQRIKEYIQEEVKGRENYHGVLVLEAEGDSNPHQLEKSSVKIEMQELTQMKDGMFQDYDKNNRDKVRSTYRLPPIYIGMSEDYTRATALESKTVAEEQVFGPEKSSFDFVINRKIFPELGVRFHKFVTKAAPIDNRKDMADMAKVMSEFGLTNNEGRKLIEGLLDIEMDEIDINDPMNDWLLYPPKIAQMYIAYKNKNQNSSGDGNSDQNAQKMVDSFIKALVQIRDNVRKTNIGGSGE